MRVGRSLEQVERREGVGRLWPDSVQVYINPPPTHTHTSQNKVSREHRDRDKEQRLWNGEHWQLRPEGQAGSRLLRGLESQLPPLTNCVTLGSFSNISVL